MWHLPAGSGDQFPKAVVSWLRVPVSRPQREAAGPTTGQECPARPEAGPGPTPARRARARLESVFFGLAASVPSRTGEALSDLRTMKALVLCSHLGQLHRFEASALHVVLPGGVMACQ